jgi:hypothetical protein
VPHLPRVRSLTASEPLEALLLFHAYPVFTQTETDTVDQQLVARIKRRSKYWGQSAPNQWFDVRVVEDTSYRLRGNNNNYRLDDVIIGVRLANGFIVDLVNGKVSRG